jgi:hypothetical protein
MPDALTETLLRWQNFYFMLGGAAAALLGLMFVAITLVMNLLNDENKSTFDTYTTPNIVYFASVILIASLMLVPVYTLPVFYAVVLIGGALGLGLAIFFVRRATLTALRAGNFNREDWFWICIMPIVSYVLLAMAAICLGTGLWPAGFSILPLGTLSLLVTAIANTWGIVIFVIYARRD